VLEIGGAGVLLTTTPALPLHPLLRGVLRTGVDENLTVGFSAKC